MNRELVHDRLSLHAIPIMQRQKSAVEIWHNAPDNDQPAHVVIAIEGKDGSEYVDLLPSEARALAHLLLNAAEHQERRSAADIRKRLDFIEGRASIQETRYAHD